MSRPEDIGARVGTALALLVDACGLGNAVRAHFAEKYGTCRRCGEPLGGPSPDRICEGCHVDEVLAEASGDKGGEA